MTDADSEISKAAAALGRLGKGKPKDITQAERRARRERMEWARSFRKAIQEQKQPQSKKI